MIDQILVFLNNTFESEGYYVKEFSDGIFFGKDRDNNIICAKVNLSKEAPFSLTTKAIELYQNYHFIMQTDNENIDGNYDLLVLKNSFVDTKKTFINLCLNFYSEDSDRGIVELTNDLIEMYKINKTKDSLAEQGLWAELFTILYLKNNYDIDISKYWHNDNYNKYDFSFSEKFKLEVKSTKKETREHRFSHEQIYTDYDVLISSVQVRIDDNGYTILDLYSEVEELFASKYDLLIKIESLLKKINKDSLDKYDFEYAKNNIKFYINNNIPHINESEPEGVHGTEYTVVLEGEDELTSESIKQYLDHIK